MPPVDISNRALSDATAEILQILTRAINCTKGHTGHLEMAMEMAKIMMAAFQAHGESATMIPPVILSAAMELSEHVDLVGKRSFLTLPIWRNILLSNSHIQQHLLCSKAHTFEEALMKGLASQPPMQPKITVMTNSLMLPAAHSTLMPIVKKTLIDMTIDSDEVEIVKEIAQTDTSPHKKQTFIDTADTQVSGFQHQGKIEMPVKVKAHIAVDIPLRDSRQKPMLKSKQMEMARASELDEVVVVDVPPMKRTVLPNHLPATGDDSGQLKPWFQDSSSLQQNAGTTTQKHGHRQAMLMEEDEGNILEDVGDISTGQEEDIGVLNHMAAAAEDMLIDSLGDTVARDLGALTLKANRDSVSLIAANKVLQDTIIDLQNQVAELCAHNAITATLIEAINICLTAQGEEVKALHAESQHHEAQLWSAEAKVASNGTSTAILSDAYESLQQHVVSNVSLPHFNHAMFFPPISHGTPYTQSMSSRQAQAMEQLYFNFIPGLSTAPGLPGTSFTGSFGIQGLAVTLTATSCAAASHSGGGVTHIIAGPSTAASQSTNNEVAGPSGSHPRGAFEESASGIGCN
ncbi:uncharacterized protein F5891DRAFT_1193892 [Suillus fuscotomentosus]|uniref:Uncharacterized protein n=1 Tax=Suillus fuscotomentosus TaxID=1912939 RepID=A0AAD4DXD9_9AGAM|nr:uncharacterized protein F5891DRAFT_1193892 [Suillus fuscotomentosus]KAG1895717.1 hypothetical protein F5891DRAFT_1193892 [Suillus fuscotomentosus]